MTEPNIKVQQPTDAPYPSIRNRARSPGAGQFRLLRDPRPTQLTGVAGSQFTDGTVLRSSIDVCWLDRRLLVPLRGCFLPAHPDCGGVAARNHRLRAGMPAASNPKLIGRWHRKVGNTRATFGKSSGRDSASARESHQFPPASWRSSVESSFENSTAPDRSLFTAGLWDQSTLSLGSS